MKINRTVTIAGTGVNTRVFKCTCDNKYMDDTYGEYNRVFNRWLKGWRCTVCGHETHEERKQ